MNTLEIKQTVIDHFEDSGMTEEILIRFGIEVKGLSLEVAEEADMSQALDHEILEFYTWYEANYMEEPIDINFVNGRAIIKLGKKIIAKIYDRRVYYQFHNIKSGYSEKYPYSLEINIGSRECEDLNEAILFIKKYTQVQNI